MASVLHILLLIMAKISFNIIFKITYPFLLSLTIELVIDWAYYFYYFYGVGISNNTASFIQ